MVLYACVSGLSSELQLESHVQSSGLETERVDTTDYDPDFTITHALP